MQSLRNNETHICHALLRMWRLRGPCKLLLILVLSCVMCMSVLGCSWITTALGLGNALGRRQLQRFIGFFLRYLCILSTSRGFPFITQHYETAIFSGITFMCV